MRLAFLPVHRTLIAGVAVAVALAACGGGNSSSSVPARTGGANLTTPAPTATPVPTAAPVPAGTWVSAWADAQANATQSSTNPASSEQTLRIILKPSVSSRGTVRVHFSNVLGSGPLTLGAAHIGVHSSGAGVVAGSDIALTFGGKPSTTIAAGSTALSDPVAMTFTYGVTLAVTEYLSGSWSSLPQVNRGVVTDYTTPSGAGDKTADVAGSSFSQKTTEAFLVDRVDVLGNYAKTVAVVGSSTTIGTGSDTDMFDDLVSDVAANLHGEGHDDIAVVNLAIAPDALLTLNTLAGNPALVDRFSRDVLNIPGIGTVIQNTADVDLKAANCSNAATILAGDQNVIAQAHAAHVRIVLAEIAPTTFCDGQNPSGFGSRFPAGTGQDAERQALNAWIRSTAPSVVDGVTVQPPGADGVVDLSTPVTDPSNVAYPLPQYDIGDDSHLNAAGQAMQAAAIPVSAISL